MAASTQQQAFTAGLRTAEQSLLASLTAIMAGSVLADATSVFTLDWHTLLGGLGLALLISVLAGLKAYLSFLVSGVPNTYVGGAVSTVSNSDVVDETAAVGGTIAALPGSNARVRR